MVLRAIELDRSVLGPPPLYILVLLIVLVIVIILLVIMKIMTSTCIRSRLSLIHISEPTRPY